MRLFNLLFGCTHQNYSWPTRLRNQRNPVQVPTGAYVVCLDCGFEMPYCWASMKIVSYTRRQPVIQTPTTPVPILEQFPQK